MEINHINGLIKFKCNGKEHKYAITFKHPVDMVGKSIQLREINDLQQIKRIFINNIGLDQLVRVGIDEELRIPEKKKLVCKEFNTFNKNEKFLEYLEKNAKVALSNNKLRNNFFKINIKKQNDISYQRWVSEHFHYISNEDMTNAQKEKDLLDHLEMSELKDGELATNILSSDICNYIIGNGLIDSHSIKALKLTNSKINKRIKNNFNPINKLRVDYATEKNNFYTILDKYLPFHEHFYQENAKESVKNHSMIPISFMVARKTKKIILNLKKSLEESNDVNKLEQKELEEKIKDLKLFNEKLNGFYLYLISRYVDSEGNRPRAQGGVISSSQEYLNENFLTLFEKKYYDN